MEFLVFLFLCTLVLGNDVIKLDFQRDSDFVTIDSEQDDWESYLQLPGATVYKPQWKILRVANVPKQSGGVVTLDFKPFGDGSPLTYEATGNNGIHVLTLSMHHKGSFVTADGELDPTEPLCGIEKIGDLLTGRRSEVTGDIAVKLAIKLCGKFGLPHISLHDQSFYACGGPDNNDYTMSTSAMYAVKGATTYYMRNHFYPCQLAETGYEPEALQFCAALFHLHHVTIGDYGKGQCADRYPMVALPAVLTSTFGFKLCVDSGAKLSWCLKTILEEGDCEKKFAFFEIFLGQGHSFAPCPIADSLAVIVQQKGYCAELVPQADTTESDDQEADKESIDDSHDRPERLSLRIKPVHFCSKFTEDQLVTALGRDVLTEADISLQQEPHKLVALPTARSEPETHSGTLAASSQETEDTKKSKSAKKKGHRSLWGFLKKLGFSHKSES
eukprot:GILJ01006596.1.p1 GENE.GILJ01006596.1~~GILJ01006596.1.p1  ORF type:complete len:460 (+),score=43.65 GILJ01006596.1:54-1382(+)